MSYASPKAGLILLLTLSGLLVLFPLAQWVGRSAGEAQKERGQLIESETRKPSWLLRNLDRSAISAPALTAASEVQVRLEREPAAGLTESQMNNSVLERMKGWLSVEMKQTQKHSAELQQVSVAVEGSYGTAGIRKVGILRAKDLGHELGIMVFGVADSDVVIVRCATASGDVISLSSGHCSDVVSRTFGSPIVDSE